LNTLYVRRAESQGIITGWNYRAEFQGRIARQNKRANNKSIKYNNYILKEIIIIEQWLMSLTLMLR